MRCLLIVRINLRLLAAGGFAHLRPNKEMLHRLLKHVQAVQHLIDIFRADVLLGLFEQRALVSRAFWPSHDISARKTMIVQCSSHTNTLFLGYFVTRNAPSASQWRRFL